MPAFFAQRRRPETAFIVSVITLVLTTVAIPSATASAPRRGFLEVGVALNLTPGLPLLGHLFLVRTDRAGRSVLLPLAATGFALSVLAVAVSEAMLPIRLGASGLHLQAGLRWRVDVEWQQVAGVHTSAPEVQALMTAFPRSPDLWIESCDPKELAGGMGITKSVRAPAARPG